jgi:hypothetical protein
VGKERKAGNKLPKTASVLRAEFDNQEAQSALRDRVEKPRLSVTNRKIIERDWDLAAAQADQQNNLLEDVIAEETNIQLLYADNPQHASWIGLDRKEIFDHGYVPKGDTTKAAESSFKIIGATFLDKQFREISVKRTEGPAPVPKLAAKTLEA